MERSAAVDAAYSVKKCSDGALYTNHHFYATVPSLLNFWHASFFIIRCFFLVCVVVS